MQIVNKLQLGPFKSHYHRELVGNAFLVSLEQFLAKQLLPKLDGEPNNADGSLIATFPLERNCGPSSLVRDIFTLELQVDGSDGTSHLKADIVYDPLTRTFSPRTGHDHQFYVWTPARKIQRESLMEKIQRLMDDIQRHRQYDDSCPICRGQLSVVDDANMFDVRCREKRCFNYNYHKDERGRLAHGHFRVVHPAMIG